MNPQDQLASQISSSDSISEPTSAPVSVSATSTPLQKIPGPFELFSYGWKLFINHWKILIPIVIFPTVIMYLGSLLNFTHQSAFTVFGGLLSVIGGVFSVVMVPAIVDAVDRLSTNPSIQISFIEQYKKGFTFFWSVILIGIIYGLVGLGSFILFIIPGIIIVIYASFYSYTLIIDGNRGFSALTESYRLVHKRWWPVFGRVVFLVVSILMIWFILLGVGFLLSMVFGIPLWEATQSVSRTSSSLGVSFISFIFNIIGSAVLAPIAIGYTYKMYSFLKEVRDQTATTKTFKNWLVAFLCVGVATIVSGIILISTLLLMSIKTSNILSNPVFQTRINSATTIQGYFPNGQYPEMIETNTK
ncbi:MAG: hypothetical protein AAB470_03240 [Patescibacteria group bacterium]